MHSAVASTAKKKLTQDETDALLEDLISKYGNRVTEVAFFYLKDRFGAEDAAQEVFLKVYENLPDFQWQSSPFTWIYRITVNHCKDKLRSWSWRKLIPFGDELLSVMIEKTPSTEDKVLQELENGEFLQQVLSLSLVHREVLTLYYYQQLSINEIAQILNTGEGTVKSRLHRARLALKEKLVKGGKADG